jgi:hypothetical protein
MIDRYCIEKQCPSYGLPEELKKCKDCKANDFVEWAREALYQSVKKKLDKYKKL